jgi:hypothetical protein
VTSASSVPEDLITQVLAFEYTGLGRGGQQIQKTKEVYAKAVETLVELASLQASPNQPYRLTASGNSHR